MISANDLRVGDVYLYDQNNNIQEVEILQIVKNADAVKLFYGWVSMKTFLSTLRGKVGHYEYKRNIFGLKRKVFIPINEKMK